MNEALSPLYPYQLAHLTNPSRFTVLNWSRQVGKTHVATLRRIQRGIKRGRNQILLSASERQSRELMLKVGQHLKVMKIAFSVTETEFHDPFEGIKFAQMEITGLPGGIRIIGLPANPATARGYTGDVLLDEFGMHKNSLAIWRAIFPSVLRGAGELDVSSTPQGRNNMFYRLMANKRFHHHTLTLYDAIAQGLDEDAEALREGIMDEESWRQEFLCEFVDEATAFLTYEMIGQCEDPKLGLTVDLGALAEHQGDVYVGVDIGRKHDLTVIWPFELVGSQLISLGLIELHKMPFRQQFELLSRLLRMRCVRRCCIDSTGLGMQLAEAAVEDFGEYRVEACTFTANLKADLAGKLRIKVEDVNIRIPASPAIRNDLHSVQKVVTAAGNIRYAAEREGGSHADRFWAAGLAVHAASDPVGKIECASGGSTRFGALQVGHRGTW